MKNTKSFLLCALVGAALALGPGLLGSGRATQPPPKHEVVIMQATSSFQGDIVVYKASFSSGAEAFAIPDLWNATNVLDGAAEKIAHYMDQGYRLEKMEIDDQYSIFNILLVK